MKQQLETSLFIGVSDKADCLHCAIWRAIAIFAGPAPLAADVLEDALAYALFDLYAAIPDEPTRHAQIERLPFIIRRAMAGVAPASRAN